jgi:peptidoglycan-associated lipoprotein
MRTLTTSALLIASTLLFTACSTTPTAETQAPASNAAATSTAGSATAKPVAAAPAAAPTAAKPATLTFIPIKRSIFFDYDSNAIKSDYQPVIEDHAKYLVANPDKKATIQGNCDERGGSEYNLALGQRRADAERKALELLGVPASQLEAISFGKEKPRTRGHNEAAWADNRRADIVYKSN